MGYFPSFADFDYSSYFYLQIRHNAFWYLAHDQIKKGFSWQFQRNRLINLEVGKLRKAYQSRTIKIGRPKAKRIEGIKKPKAKRVRDKKGEDKKGEDKKREDKKGEDKKREGKKREDKKGEDKKREGKKREGKKGEDKKRDGKKREGKKGEDKKRERSVVWRTQVRKIKTVAKRKRDLAKKAKKRAQKKDAKK